MLHILYKKLLKFYPGGFRERFGESMQQTFNDLYNERQQRTQHGLSIFVLWAFFETSMGITREYVYLIKQGDFMKNILTNPRSASIFSFILILPLVLLFPIAALEIEPFYGLIQSMFVEADGYTTTVFGKIIMIVTILLLPFLAFIANFIPIMKNVRAGNSVLAHPVNLLLGIAISSFFIIFIGGFILDQYPCWMGVPNCD
jgi:hypothetical protein